MEMPPCVNIFQGLSFIIFAPFYQIIIKYIIELVSVFVLHKQITFHQMYLIVAKKDIKSCINFLRTLVFSYKIKGQDINFFVSQVISRTTLYKQSDKVTSFIKQIYYYPQKQKVMRPSSQRSSSSSHARPGFQTKMKSRVKGHSSHAADQLQFSNARTSRIQSLNTSRHNQSQCMHNDDVFNQTATKLAKSNFSHHDPTQCVCEKCQCGRHLCKFHVIKPDIPKATVYQKSFYNQKGIQGPVVFAQEYDRLQGPHLDMNSTYLSGFNGKNGDKLERPHPEDLLHSNGPSPNLTSYSTQFPGHKGDNQYVKPTDKHTRGYFPLRSKSTYANEFKAKQPKKDDYTYFPDQLRTGSNWYGNTTYGNFYAEPNPEYFAKKVKVVEKKQENPDFVHQYETTYKNDFIKKDNPICPAKVYLETKAQGLFSGTKSKFNENADFKAMSPNFQAISTSKHSYV